MLINFIWANVWFEFERSSLLFPVQVYSQTTHLHNEQSSQSGGQKPIIQETLCVEVGSHDQIEFNWFKLMSLFWN